tara:strand:- start:355 stop:1203 length:849 start_codon:yes stop_codon:yes gene_type:complete
MSFKSGFVSIVGNPNVGKSSLFNSILDYNLSIVTNKSQTTRVNIKGIITSNNFQIILSDTPGHIESSYLLHDKMNKNIFRALEGTDLVIYVTDVKEKKINNKLIEIIVKKSVPIIFVINKSDLNKNFDSKLIKGNFLRKYLISTKNKEDVNELIQFIVQNLPEHPAYYSTDELTDKNERFLVSEIVREKIFELFSQEIPYSTHVEIMSFHNEKEILKIEGNIYTESETQKSILIGKKGKMIRNFSEKSRMQIEKIYNKKVYINFTIKVRKWRNDESFIKKIF